MLHPVAHLQLLLTKAIIAPSRGDFLKTMSRIAFVVLTSVLGFFSILLPFHMWLVNPKSISSITFPIEGFIAKKTISCTSNAPLWMPESIEYFININGAITNQIAYIKKNGEEYHCHSGWISGVPLSESITESTRFRFASLTKMVTADLILRLVNERRLSLTTTLSELFPENESYKDARISSISVAQLLNHTAGFDRTTLLGDEMFSRNKKPWCPYSVKNLSNMELMYTPGEKQVYSNTGYCLLGVIIERITGKSYEEYSEQVYGLRERGIEFIEGGFMRDEPIYDFRREFFFPENYYTWFDFKALSSSAGLSGSASALSKLIWEGLHSKPFNLTTPPTYSKCDRHSFHGCYGFAMYSYSEFDGALDVFLHEGYLPGASSLAIIDEVGGVTVMLSAGGPENGFEDNKKLYYFLYKSLSKFYQN